MATRAATRVELIRQEAAKGATVTALAAKYKLTGAAVKKILSTAPPPRTARPPAPPSPAPVIPAVTGPTDSQRDAVAELRGALDQWGLGSLADWAWGQVTSGRSKVESVQALRETPEYKTRFRVIEQRKQKGLSPISEQEVLDWERAARSVMSAAGLPASFYDQQEDFDRFILADLSPAELRSRINDGYLEAAKAPAEDIAALRRYGLGDGDLAAFFIDPERAEPVIMRNWLAAKTSGAAVRAGYGDLTQTEAERLASVGVSGQQAEAGFGQLVQSRELFNPLDSGETAIGRVDQLAALGGDQGARSTIENRAARRKATFGGGGSVAATQRGVSGLGSAAT